MEEVEISPTSPDRFEELLEPDRYRRFADALDGAARALSGRTLWHINSTAEGGGVAEMLQSLLGYLRGVGIETRWLVVEGNDEFFEVTKRLHNLLHGERVDGADVGEADRGVYERTLAANLPDARATISPGDVVILHDPQTVGLAPAVKEAGARSIWSCHVGVDDPNDLARRAWDFLRPYVDQTMAHVFSRRAYAWEGLSAERVAVIPPCIDAFSPKNQPLDQETVAAILRVSGVVPDAAGDGGPSFRRQDGTPAQVRRRAELIEDEPIPASSPLVAQVSRWDRLKDPVGVITGFAGIEDDRTGAHLLMAGPAADSVADDPESDEVLAEVRKVWGDLPAAIRRRVHVACLPMDDLDENAASVNAVQRRGDVIVQKSLAEGFGLTVAEAMWKKRPVVGSRVGGIQDQIVDGESGLLVDPDDPGEFARAVTTLLEDREAAARLGGAAHARVCEEYIPPRYLGRFMDLVDRVLAE